MTSRDAMLGRIRAALGRDGCEAPPGLPGSLRTPLIPARGRGAPAELVARFAAMADEAAATVARAPVPADVPEAIAAWLAKHDLPRAIAMAPDTTLDALPWADAPSLTIRRGGAQPDDSVAVTPAFAGIAETGSLMVHSGATTPYALNFLPDTHIAVLDASRIVGAYEDAWTLLRSERNALPRTVTLITGPSRSSDIERTVTIGVHGPRRLHIVIVGRVPGEKGGGTDGEEA